MAQRLRLGPILGFFSILAVGGGLYVANNHGLLGPVSAGSAVVPVAAPLATIADTSVPVANIPMAPLPSTQAAAVAGPEIRVQEMAWNSQTGLNYANGGIHPTQGSLMQKHGVNLHIVWEDDVGKQMTALTNFAVALKKNPQPTEGAHFAALMGDGSAASIGAVMKDLKAAGADPEIIGSAGYSRGEDQLMGQAVWKQDPNQMRGALVSGYLRDGDWNIALKFAGDNGIPNNPDEKTWDPSAINWHAADDYIKAADDYINGVCEDRPVVHNGKKTGETKHVCINGVVTWTPGDVNVAEKKGGLSTIVSTRDYRSQMPNTLIGIKQWDQANKGLVVEMLAAMFEGGDQVKAFPQALTRACEANSVIWSAPGGGGGQPGSYWETYFKGVTKADKQGIQVSLGGSSVNNLQDNLVLYGLAGGPNVFAATYTVFADIVKQQYPKMVPSMLPVEQVLHTEYVLAVKAKYGQQAAMAADVPTFNANVNAPITQKLGDRNWAINFDTGKASFGPEAKAQLTELMNGLLIAGTAVIEVDGHTDNTGDAGRNMALSQSRAQAVKDWLIQQGVDRDRFIKVQGFGDTVQVASNETETGKAKNRRVTIILGKH